MAKQQDLELELEPADVTEPDAVSALEKMLRAMWRTPAGQGRHATNVFLWGPPGVGKTLRVLRAARAEGRHAEVVLLSLREPSDVGGLPFLTKDSVSLQPPAWARRLADAGARGQPTLLFVDEFNGGTPATQSAFLRVANERVVGDIALPPNCAIVAAANPTDQAAGGNDLALATANRWVHMDVKADFAEWCDWLLMDGGEAGVSYDYLGEEEQRWRSLYAEERGNVTAFLGRRPALLLAPPQPDDPNASRGWPSPRSWEQFARVRAGARFSGLPTADIDSLMTGAVGAGPTTEFIAWLVANDLPDMASILDGRTPWVKDKRLDRIWAALSAGAALVAPASALNRTARATRLWSIIADIAKTTPDVTVPSARALVKAKLHTNKAGTQALAALQPVLAAAGVRA